MVNSNGVLLLRKNGELKKTGCRNAPAPLFTIDIAGPFLDDPFRWLATAASP